MNSPGQLDLNIRLDQLLYYLRLFKTRGIATNAIEKGTCKVNNFLVKKKNKVVNIGDIIDIKNEKVTKKIKILKIPLRKGPFKEAIIHYEDITPIFAKEVNKNKYIKKISFGRRPTKSSRRKLDKFTGRNF
ncbi:S4 domain-containing protein [Alphaproteobacteria bacterium]|nr:S4 domain-containing protein [Alphaproteobacteria bacterium]